MAEPLKLEEQGNQILVHMDDGSKRTAVPTVGGLFYVTDNYTPPTPPPPPSSKQFIWPFGLDTVTSEYGPRSGRVHQGIDFGKGAAHNGANIIAAGAGRAMLRRNSGFGNHIIIDHGNNIFTVYAHMQDGGFRVSDGARVGQGQLIGIVGNTGNSFGAHLHWETHVGGLNWSNPGTHMNPRVFMSQYG